MEHFSKSQINSMDKIFRLNLINSCTGYKSANLIGTSSDKDILNLTVLITWFKQAIIVQYFIKTTYY